MDLRNRLRRLQRAAEGSVVSILQQDGTVKRFPEQLQEAFLSAVDRATGRTDSDELEHPVCAAARNSSDPEWRNSFYVTEAPEGPVEDLSE